MSYPNEFEHRNGFEVAIIGMAGRFPAASDLDQFWLNLRNGVESISSFTEAEIVSSGLDPEILKHPNYVNACATLDDIELFDASFFGYSPREAEIIDPQQRIFLECAYEALENAGYNPQIYKGLIGVYAGVGMNAYLQNVYSNRERKDQSAGVQVVTSNDKDHLTTRVAYKLGLRGPSITVQTACSTSLVAVQLAHQALLCGACDIALAGGAKVRVIQKAGYFYQDGGIMSPDGHCRAFDAEAQGTVGGSGVGIVVLKRLEDALADGDCVQAVIKGAAVNNDGSAKVGYTAPGVKGQARVIRAAQLMAGVNPETITYVETHGTGTALGDPVEIAALTEAYRAGTQKKKFCAIGSLKPNIGHLDTAAGVAGLIKTVLALKNKELPPSIHFERPNPHIDFENSPVYVNAALTDWKSNGHPRRAGVSSFGIGGTNAHVVLEEAPPSEESDPSGPWNLLVLSARTEKALNNLSANLAAHLRRHPDINVADVAYTLQVGRKSFSHRQVLVCGNVEDAATTLAALEPGRVFRSVQDSREIPVAFMFPGQGTQYANMGRELYLNERVFRQQVDLCSDLLKPHLEPDLRDILYPSEEATAGAAAQERLRQTHLTQPALFVTEYALARLWMWWGVKPQAMIGHSIGEYVAACLAGVFSLEDALRLVAARGRLMQSVPEGAMLSVPLPDQEVEAMLGDQLSLAAVNGPSRCVVSGPADAIQELEQRLTMTGETCRRLQTSHAFHSRMMEPILQSFTELVGEVALKPPTIPFISNVTGTWMSDADATDPAYWAGHLRRTVRFGDGLAELLKEPARLFLEVGPGDTASAAVRRYPQRRPEQQILSSLRRSDNHCSDLMFIQNSLGRLWLAGKSVSWPEFNAQTRRRRLPLPTYPYERQRYWIERQRPDAATAAASPATRTVDDAEEPRQEEAAAANSVATNSRHEADQLRKKPDIADWFYVPAWKQVPSHLFIEREIRLERRHCWIVFLDECGIGARLTERLKRLEQDVVTVGQGNEFARLGDQSYAINVRRRADYEALLEELHTLAKVPERIVHLWNVTPHDLKIEDDQSLEALQYLSFYSLLYLAQAFGEKMPAPAQAAPESVAPVQFEIVSNNMQKVGGEELLWPEKATAIGPCRVIPLEYPHIACRSVDITLPVSADRQEELADWLIAEFSDKSSDAVVAYRFSQRWVQTFEPVRLEAHSGQPLRLRDSGVYLITGGLGGMGLALAEFLATTVKAKLVLIGRSAFPVEDQWENWLATHDEQDEVSRKIRKLQELRYLGAQILVFSADVSDLKRMQEVMVQAGERFGPLHGVIHTAGVPPAQIIQRGLPELSEGVLAPKLRGTRVLSRICQDTQLDFLVLCSSQRSLMGGFGAVDYTAANAYLDAFARSHNSHQGTAIVSIIWDNWREVGMSVKASQRVLKEEGIGAGMSSREGMEVFSRVLRSALAEVIVSMHDLSHVIDYNSVLARYKALANQFSPAHARPELATAYVAPSNEIEQTLAAIWQELLGVDKIGINDNFFELGGDSVISLRIVARATQAGVRLTPRQVFECPTIASLAAVAGTSTPDIQAEQGLVAGDVPLLPLQHWFFEQDIPQPQHWNQAVFLEVRERFEVARLESVFRRLLEHHDVLRQRFIRTDSGWRQTCAGEVESVPLTSIDLSQVPEREQASAIERAAVQLQTGLSLQGGDLIRIGYFDLGEDRSSRLLMVIHHLLIDIISWRTLLEDLRTLLLQPQRETAIRLPPKTTSFKQWAEKLSAYARSDKLTSELDYWLAEHHGEVASLPLDYVAGDNTVGSAGTVSVSLSPEETRSLLQRVPQAYGTQINDALLTALALAFTQWTGKPFVLVSLEGHGRDPIFEEADLSRTVGWFTSVYPVMLKPGANSGAHEAIMSIREQLSRIPNGGIGYGLLRYMRGDEEIARKLAARPQPQVSFLYLGQTGQGQQSQPGISDFMPASESCGAKRDPAGRRPHVIEVSGSTSEGQLRMNWSYSENLHRRETVEELAQFFLRALRSIIGNGELPVATARAEWDFPLAQLPPGDLEKAFRELDFEER